MNNTQDKHPSSPNLQNSISRFELKTRLDRELSKRNHTTELSYDKPDPLMVASRYRDEKIALICALFGYGNAAQIVKFLDRLDFGLLAKDDDSIYKNLSHHYYRFQKSDDIAALFVALKRLDEIDTIENIFYEGYQKKGDILDGLWLFISTLRRLYPRGTHGYDFLVGKPPRKLSQAGTYKRYMMFLRWMVRSDNLDMGLWSRIPPQALIMPLDTHTFHVSRRLGLLERKSYDLKAALQLTDTLRTFDPNDPVKYDFAIYRLGQEKQA